MIELPSGPRGRISSQRLWLARGVAAAADVVQLGLFPVDIEGIVSPIDAVLDAGVAAVMILLLGWHIAFLPSFLIKALPVADLAPTWTVAVWIATRGRVPRELPEDRLPLLDGGAAPLRGDVVSGSLVGGLGSLAARLGGALIPILVMVDAWMVLQAARGRERWPLTLGVVLVSLVAGAGVGFGSRIWTGGPRRGGRGGSGTAT